MARTSTQQDGGLHVQGGFWKLRWREGAIEANAERIAREHSLSRADRKERAPQSAMTVADFVENVFVPEHVAAKKLSGRTHFQAILKHVLTPERVNRVFHAGGESLNGKLKAVAGWPYLDNARLGEVRPDDVQRLISEAVAHGYSAQTVTHIRNVVKAVFEHARKSKCCSGENPAGPVKLPGMTRKEAHALTLAQAREVLGVMRYPEREMTLIAILTNVNVAEICGLQWKYVNLTEAWSTADGEPIPPRTIAVRKRWYRGELGSLSAESRNRHVPVPGALLPILLQLSRRREFRGPDDFVLVSRAGTPVNENRIAERRLKPIGKDLQMPWLSWQVFRRTHASLAYELGRRFQDQVTLIPEETESAGARFRAAAPGALATGMEGTANRTHAAGAQ